MSVRGKYKIAQIRIEIEHFKALIQAELFDKAVEYFRANLDKPTLYGLVTSLKRVELLRQINVIKLTDSADKCFVLYNLALALNLTGGYPNLAIPLYERHYELAERIGDDKSLSQSLGHYAKALRQVGRFYESEKLARKGLKIIRERQDFLREAVNLYWLGMGLAHRGDAENSEIALQRSLRIFKAKFADQAEGVVNAFLAQKSLWTKDYVEALNYANKALAIGTDLENDKNHADLHGAVKILTAGLRMKGEALVLLGNLSEGEDNLQIALQRAREIEFVEEELPALRSLALKALQTNELVIARNYLEQTWKLAERGQFLLYNADSYNILASIELADGNHEKAVEAAQKAFQLSICDGIPFAYQRGLEDATILLNKLETAVLSVPKFVQSEFEPLSALEINPNDEFNA
jgi:tetratricopeptide (TPR) repeat protein